MKEPSRFWLLFPDFSSSPWFFPLFLKFFSYFSSLLLIFSQFLTIFSLSRGVLYPLAPILGTPLRMDMMSFNASLHAHIFFSMNWQQCMLFSPAYHKIHSDITSGLMIFVDFFLIKKIRFDLIWIRFFLFRLIFFLSNHLTPPKINQSSSAHHFKSHNSVFLLQSWLWVTLVVTLSSHEHDVYITCSPF